MFFDELRPFIISGYTNKVTVVDRLLLNILLQLAPIFRHRNMVLYGFNVGYTKIYIYLMEVIFNSNSNAISMLRS